VASALSDVLGGDLLALYLYGSAVLGGLQHESDLDLLAVSRRRLHPEERRRLMERTTAVSGVLSSQRPGRPIELTVVVLDEVRPFQHPARHDLQYGEWEDPERFRNRVDPDLTTLLSIVLLGGHPLVGPPPGELLDPVPQADLLRAVTTSIDDVFQGLHEDTRNLLLTLARIWCTVETGQIRPKDEAADWVLRRVPEEHRPVLALARDAYRGEREDRWDGLAAQVQAHAAFVAARIPRIEN
jgi:predicted nucleotidyltransferase